MRLQFAGGDVAQIVEAAGLEQSVQARDRLRHMLLRIAPGPQRSPVIFDVLAKRLCHGDSLPVDQADGDESVPHPLRQFGDPALQRRIGLTTGGEVIGDELLDVPSQFLAGPVIRER